MYKWYSRSAVCFVYMSDVCYSPSDILIIEAIRICLLFQSMQSPSWQRRRPGFSDFRKWDPLKHQFRNSSWFKRGWTLQELLAPLDIKFLDQHWNLIGEFGQLEEDISETTDIDREYLGSKHRGASIAQKMSWASRRKTSRGEDLAYCLLGLFDINMPLLYGEGADKAFYRLQSEILRSSNDESVFAWRAPMLFSGMLAAHPGYFADSGDFGPIASDTNIRPPYTITNRGLQISIPEADLPLGTAAMMTTHLHCSRTSRAATFGEDHASGDQALVVHLFRHEESYLRFGCHTLQCTLRKPHPMMSAEGNPNNFCAIYILCSQVPFSVFDKAQLFEMDYEAFRNEMSSRMSVQRIKDEHDTIMEDSDSTPLLDKDNLDQRHSEFLITKQGTICDNDECARAIEAMDTKSFIGLSVRLEDYG